MKQQEFEAQMEKDFNDQADLYAGQPDVVPEPTTLDHNQSKLHEKGVEYNIPELVHNPSHYQFFDTTVIEHVEKVMDIERYLGYLIGTAIVYRLRAGKKDGNSAQQDIDKAMVYEQYYHDFVKKNTP